MNYIFGGNRQPGLSSLLDPPKRTAEGVGGLGQGRGYHHAAPTRQASSASSQAAAQQEPARQPRPTARYRIRSNSEYSQEEVLEYDDEYSQGPLGSLGSPRAGQPKDVRADAASAFSSAVSVTNSLSSSRLF